MRPTRSVIFSLLDTPAFGGAEQYLFSQLKSLHERGSHIYLATNNEQVKAEIQSRLTATERRTFEVVRAPYRLDAIGNWKGLLKFFLSGPFALSWCFWTLWSLRQRFDTVICLWPGFSDRLLFSPLTTLVKSPLIWIEIGPLEPTFKKNWGFPRWLYRLAQRFPDHVITTSLFTRDSILRQTRFTSDDITLVYPGTQLFSTREFDRYRRQGQTWAKKQRLTGTLFGVVARLAHENEVDNVIQAFALFLKKSRRPATLIIIGDGPQRAELTALTHRLKLAAHVHLTGFVSETEKRQILASCDFFIFPRAWELDGFGMTTIEAMALGLPVLTTDFGPQIEIVTNDQEGYRYPPRQPKALAKYLTKMTQLTPTKRKRMSHAARQRVKAFSEARSHRQLYQVIRKFASGTV